jgi:hypothetical protein
LAVVVNILVHDHGPTTSLLTQLGIKHLLRFRSSGHPIRKGNMLSDLPLIMMSLSDAGARYQPHLDAGPPIDPRWIPFTSWWEEIVLQHGDRVRVSRKDLAISMRNQDGGGHVDRELKDKGYVAFSRQVGTGFQVSDGDGRTKPMSEGPHLATMRQIAWEAEQSVSAVAMMVRRAI